MIYGDCGQVYLKLLIKIPFKSNSDKEAIFEKIDKNKSLEYIETNLIFEYKENLVLLFKLDYNSIGTFTNSKDFIFIEDYIREYKIDTLLCRGYEQGYYKAMHGIFKELKIVHSDEKSIYLSICGIELLHTISKDNFYKITDINIRKLNTVGKLNKLSDSDKIHFSEIQNINQKELYPYIMGNIIEGSSVYKINSKTCWERLGGSSFGSTTFWGLAQLCCGYKSPIEAIKDALEGDTSEIDLSIKDIFGKAYETGNLPEDLIASSFGKLKKISDINTLKKKDISRSLMTLFCLCNGQILALLSTIEKLNTVYLVGNPFSVLEFQQFIQSTVSFVSKESVTTLFTDFSPFLYLIGLLSLNFK